MQFKPLDPGTILSDKYELLGVLGKGGMGVVYSGRHIKLGRRVAIKTLIGDGRLDSAACVRFEREARAAATLKSRFVASVEDVAALPDGAPYMVMELLEGTPLDVELEQRGRLGVGEAVDFILQACSALHEAHRANIVHRDIKPANLFIASEGSERIVKVLDFGISKFADGDEKRVTQTGLVLGTPMFMSPEQIRSSKTVDHRTDVWSIGVVLYEALTGRPPFDGENAASVIAAITADEPTSPHEIEADIPLELSDAVLKALAKWPDKRFATIADFADAIQPFAASFRFEYGASGPGSSRNSTGGGVASPVAYIPTEQFEVEAVVARPARRWAMVAVAFAVTAVGVFAALGSRVAPSSSQSAPQGPSSTSLSAPDATNSAVSGASPTAPWLASSASASAEPAASASASASPRPGVAPSSRPTSSSGPLPAGTASVVAPVPPASPPKPKPVGGDGYLINL